MRFPLEAEAAIAASPPLDAEGARASEGSASDDADERLSDIAEEGADAQEEEEEEKANGRVDGEWRLGWVRDDQTAREWEKGGEQRGRNVFSFSSVIT